MFAYLIRRILQMVPVMFIVTGLIFAMLWAIPGDPARAFVGPGEVLDEQQLALIRQQHNFDKPVIVQYALWLSRIGSGDLGRSALTNRRVGDELWPRKRGLDARAGAGRRASGDSDLGVRAGIVSAVCIGDGSAITSRRSFRSAPSRSGFWLGIVMILLFGVELRWLPVQGYVALSDDPARWLSHIILPAIALGVTSCALIMRQTRSAMLEVLAQDYVRTARAKKSNIVVIWIHALRNALLPVITLLGLQIGHIFAGAVVIETLFGIPGMGSLLVQAIFQRDFAIVQASVLLIAVVVLLANLVTDIACAWLDPRIKYGA